MLLRDRWLAVAINVQNGYYMELVNTDTVSSDVCFNMKQQKSN